MPYDCSENEMLQPSGLRVVWLSDMIMMLAFPPTDLTAAIAAAGRTPVRAPPGNVRRAFALAPVVPAESCAVTSVAAPLHATARSWLELATTMPWLKTGAVTGIELGATSETSNAGAPCA